MELNHFIKNIDGTVEQDKVFVCDRLLHKIGQIDPVNIPVVNSRFNQNGEVSFRVYKNNNGKIHPFWDKINDIGIILVEGKGYFEIAVPDTEEDAIYKEVHGVTLGEAETSQTNITIYFNDLDDANWDESDIDAEYISAILYDPTDPERSMLDRIFRHMPHYSIGHVDASVAILQRTFAFENISVQSALQQIAEEIECIFIFDKFARVINCYDLRDYCTNPSCVLSGKNRKVKNGICPICNSSAHVHRGYGKHTGVHINTNNLADALTVTGNKDAVKNTLKIVGGDDMITNLIGQRLMDGNKITKFSKYQMSQMSEELQNALIAHQNIVNANQSEYNRLWDIYNDCLEQIEYYKSGMMPSLERSGVDSRWIFNETFGNNRKIDAAFMTSRNQEGQGVLNSIKSQFNWFLPKEFGYEMNLISFTALNSITFSIKIYLKRAFRENETTTDQYSANVTLPVKNGYTLTVIRDGQTIYTTEYFQYLMNKLKMVLEKNNATDEFITFNPPVSNGSSYDQNTTPSIYANYDEEANQQNLPSIHYTMYCVNRLQSFKDAYEACTSIVTRLNHDITSNNASILQYITANGGVSNIYNDLVAKYAKYTQCIDARMTYLNNKITTYETTKADTFDQIKTIQDRCRLKDFIINNYGEDYWKELCTFIREDVYTNNNFFAEGLKQADINENIELLIDDAKEAVEKSCEIEYSVNATVDNLLTIDEFQPFWKDFQLGNWIACTIDDFTYNLRLVGITYDYTNIDHIELEFSTTTKVKDSIADIQDILSQAQNISTNFNVVARQAQRGNSNGSDFAVMRQQGLDVANTMILNAGIGEYTLNEYGFTGRIWDDDRNTYAREQIRIINNLLCFTSDSWGHTELALGKIWFYNYETDEYEWRYGLNAGVLISDIVLSRYLRVTNDSGTMSMTNDGFILENGTNKIIFRPAHPSMEFLRNGTTILAFNTPQHPNELYIEGGILRSRNSGISNNSFLIDLDNGLIDLGGIIIDHNLYTHYPNLADIGAWWYTRNESVPSIPIYIFKARIAMLCSCNIETSMLSAESIMVRNDSNPSAIYLNGSDGVVYASSVSTRSGSSTTSDRNKKHDIVDLEDDLVTKFINALIPKSYKLDDGTSGRSHWGMIAQDVEELIKKFGLSSTDFAGFIKWKNENWDGKNPDTEYEYALRYEEFIAPLIKYCQSLYRTNVEQQKEIDDLKNEMKNMKEQIEELKKLIRGNV